MNYKTSAVLRGIAILGIILHNYTHWLAPMVQENEYTFTEMNVRRMMVELAHPSMELFAHLLSFFGHYGVPVFLFISGYGLVKKYDQQQVGIRDFIWKHYKKLFLMMIVGYGSFLMIDNMVGNPRHYTFENVLGGIFMVSNFYADPDRAIWPGPYWYFGLMVQAYVFYRLVLHRGKGSVSGLLSARNADILAIALAFISIVAQYAFDPESLELAWYRYNIFGSIAPFVLGILTARHSDYLDPRIDSASKSAVIAVLLASLAFIVMGSTSFWLWGFVPLAVCVFHVALVRLLPECLKNPLAWVGGISAAMFVSHPIARKVIIPISRSGDLYTGLLIYLVCAIVLGMLFSVIQKSIVSQHKNA